MSTSLTNILNQFINSDLDVQVEQDTHDVILKFIAPWIPDGIKLSCHHIHSYRVARNPEQGDIQYFVGLVKLSEDILRNRHAEGWDFNDPRKLLEKKVWVIEVEGTVNIEIV